MVETPVSQDDKLLGAVSYVSVVSVFMYVMKKNNPFVVFHAKQGMILFVASMLWFIPILGWIIAAIAYVLMVIGFIKAYSGDKFKMPLIGDLAEKIKF